MGFFSDFNKNHLQLPEAKWEMIEDTPSKKVWINDDSNTIELHAVLDTNGIPKKRGGEILYKFFVTYGGKWVSTGVGTYDELRETIERHKQNFNGIVPRYRIKKKPHSKIKRKPAKKINKNKTRKTKGCGCK
jgi:hypothetical protein